MRAKVLYYIILSLDIPKQEHPPKLRSVKPSMVRFPKFCMTETGVEDPEWCKVHRKYCGILSPEETEVFLDNHFTDTIKTMGSLTLEFGWLPAISFSNENENYFLNAYVSPIIEQKDEETILEKMVGRPDAEEIRKRVGYKLGQLLDVLENFFGHECIGKSFFVDLQQLHLDFEGPLKRVPVQ